MMSIRSLADFNRSSLGGDGDWLTPPPSPPRPGKPGRHGERGMGTFNWPPARTSTWPYTGTFSWPRTLIVRVRFLSPVRDVFTCIAVTRVVPGHVRISPAPSLPSKYHTRSKGLRCLQEIPTD